MNAWLPVTVALPRVDCEPWAMEDSDWVLVRTERREQHIACLRIIKCPGEPDYAKWVQRGRDGWDLEGVTHWRPLEPDPTEYELRAAAEEAHKVLARLIADLGGCDHSVGICACDDIRARDGLRQALDNLKGIT